MDHARLLCSWRDERLLGLTLEKQVAHAGSQLGTERRLLQERTVLAMALVYTSRKLGTAVDDVMLTDVASQCRQLDAEQAADLLRLPAGESGKVPTTSDFPKVLEAVAFLLDEVTKRVSAGKLGHTARVLHADPEGFHTGMGYYGGWFIDCRTAVWHMRLCQEKIREGQWVVSSEDRAAARRTGLLQDPVYDYPAAPTPGDQGYPSWLQRAHRLVALGTVLISLSRALPRDPKGYDGPLATMMTSVGGACRDLEVTVQELDRLWAGHDAGGWEHEHVPEEVVVQTLATEGLVREFAVLLSRLIPAE